MDGVSTNHRTAGFRKKLKLPELKFLLSKILQIKVPLDLDLFDAFVFLKITYKK